MNINDFIQKINELGIKYDESILNKLEIYYQFLKEYNEHTNLTSIIEKKDVYLKHFYDSLTICKEIDLSKITNMIDIGTGAGFPGLIIKIFYPHINVTLLDSNNKKTKFLNELVSKLSLNGVTIINERAEDYAKNHLNEYDLCTSRAVAYMDIILSLSIPLIKLNGSVLLMKGNLDNEASILTKYQQELNIKDIHINSFNLLDNQERNLVHIHKKNETNKLLTYSQIKKRHDKWSICK